MRVYVLDLRRPREWAALLLRDVVLVQDVNDTLRCGPADVLICHGVDEGSRRNQILRRAADGPYVIFVAGAKRPAERIGCRGYLRGAPVLREDTRFGEYLAQFCADLEENGEPNFGLLEPPRWPAPLVAVYLLCLARERRGDHELPALDPGNFWEPAREEVVEREGHDQSWRDAELPTNESEYAGWESTVNLEKAMELLQRHVVPGRST